MEESKNMCTEERAIEPTMTSQLTPQAVMVRVPDKQESPLLKKLRQGFEITGLVSLLFGVLFTISFYQAGAGINIIAFTAVMIALLLFVMKRLDLPMRKGTWFYYLGSLLAGLSSAITSSEILHLLNLILIICLLNLSLLHQLHRTRDWDVQNYLGKMFGMLFFGIASIGMPFMDGMNFLKRTRLFRNDKTRSIFVGVLISMPLLWIVISLLAKADMIFGAIIEELIGRIFSVELVAVVMMVLFGFFSCYCILCGAAAQTGREEKSRKKGASSIAATVILLVTLLYLVFCALQLMYLFNNGLFALPEGYTFAEYARRGFFELLAVAVLNVGLILIAAAYFEESTLLRSLLTLMTACTYIMICSAAYRMLLYIGAYHLTFLRLFVLLTLVIISFVLAGVILTVYRRSFPLFHYCVTVTTLCYLAFALSKPDYLIASYLVEHNSILSVEDAAYLTMELSLDAAPVALPVLSEESRWISKDKQGKAVRDSKEGWTEEIGLVDLYKQDYYNTIQRKNQNRDIRDYNRSISNAKELTERYPLTY